MNTQEKFEEVYSKILSENGKDLELVRKEAKKERFQNRIILLVAVILEIIFLFFTFNLFNSYIEIWTWVTIMFNLVLVLIFLKIIKSYKATDYNTLYKAKIIRGLINSFNENLEYSPSLGLPSYEYEEAEFEYYDIYKAEDKIKGILDNNCEFGMCEVETKVRYEDSDGNTSCSTVFCGMFAEIETPKLFKDRLYLRQDLKNKGVLHKLSKLFSTTIPFPNNLRVELDSQEFEKYFDVYCSNKIIAMQLLTADIMQLLIDFQKEMNMKYELTIKDNYIYMRFMSGKMFEVPSISKFSLDKELMYKYYRMLDFSFTLTDKLVNLIKNTEYDN